MKPTHEKPVGVRHRRRGRDWQEHLAGHWLVRACALSSATTDPRMEHGSSVDSLPGQGHAALSAPGHRQRRTYGPRVNDQGPLWTMRCAGQLRGHNALRAAWRFSRGSMTI